MALVTPSKEYSFYEQDMSFYVAFTLNVERVES
jgi:hypothetical protein